MDLHPHNASSIIGWYLIVLSGLVSPQRKLYYLIVFNSINGLVSTQRKLYYWIVFNSIIG